MSEIPDEVRNLIDKMKEAHRAAAADEIETELATVDKKHEGWVEAPSADGAIEVTRQLFLVKEQKKALEQVEETLATTLKILIGDSPGILANGTPLAKVSHSTPTRVNTEVIKEQFPPDQYPMLYKTSEQTTLYIDPTFKKAVWVEQGEQQIEK